MLKLNNLTKVYPTDGDPFLAVDNLSLEVERGEFVVLIGASGCGKTTTLKMINHLIEPTSGEILINDVPTQSMNVVQLRREIGYVIQNIGLFPHLTIAANIEIVPKLKKIDKHKRRARTRELLEMVDLDPEIYEDRYPAELSGGQQQRIGVLRALAGDSDLILMDEPFGALDPITRDQLQDEMKDLQQRLSKTIVFVTHDIDEAIKLADKIVLMRDGVIVQAASPQEMLKNPANDYVRDFIGEERLVPNADVTPVSEIMLTEPLTISQEAEAAEVVSKMQKRGSDFAVIVDSSRRFAGIITAHDIQLKNIKGKSLPRLSERQAQAILDTTTIRDAASKLANGTRLLCVVDRKQRPVGLVSRTALLRGIVDLWDGSKSNDNSH